MKIGERYLITCDEWFWAPDGENYKAVHGTVHGVVDSTEALGVRTNARSTNWYVVIGDMVIAGCQVHYAVRADAFDPTPGRAEIAHEGQMMHSSNVMTRIYNADASGLVPGVR